MDFYMIMGIGLILVVAVMIIAAVRIYMRVRVDTGYHTGRYYRRNQHMGAFIGNYHMDQMGVGDESEADRVDTNEEMYHFTDSDK